MFHNTARSNFIIDEVMNCKAQLLRQNNHPTPARKPASCQLFLPTIIIKRPNKAQDKPCANQLFHKHNHSQNYNKCIQKFNNRKLIAKKRLHFTGNFSFCTITPEAKIPGSFHNIFY